MKILIAKQERSLSTSLTKLLQLKGFDVDNCFDGVQAIDMACNNNYDLIIIEKDIPRINGQNVLKELKKSNIFIKSIGLIHKSEIEEKNLTDFRFDLLLPKPFIKDNLFTLIDLLSQDIKDLGLDENVFFSWKEKLVLEKLLDFNEIKIQELNSIVGDKNIFGDGLFYINSIRNKLVKLKDYPIKDIKYFDGIYKVVNKDDQEVATFAVALGLIRFRSVNGKADEMVVLLGSVISGLVFGLGYASYSVIFSIPFILLFVLLAMVPLFKNKRFARERLLKITVPESLDYSDMFKTTFEHYLKTYEEVEVKTTGMGSMFKISYKVLLKNDKEEKELIDELELKMVT